MNEDVTSIANRVLQLERQNLVMRITTILVLCCCVYLIIDSRNSTPPLSFTTKKITAEEFVLVDSNGIQRGRWAIDRMEGHAAHASADSDGASLRFYAPDQAVLCALEVKSDSGGALMFGSKEGQHFLLMGAKNDFQMIAGHEGFGPMRLTSSKFQGGHIGDQTMHHLELRNAEGKTVFSSSDFYGFSPQTPKP